MRCYHVCRAFHVFYRLIRSCFNSHLYNVASLPQKNAYPRLFCRLLFCTNAISYSLFPLLQLHAGHTLFSHYILQRTKCLHLCMATNFKWNIVSFLRCVGVPLVASLSFAYPSAGETRHKWPWYKSKCVLRVLAGTHALPFRLNPYSVAFSAFVLF